MSYTAQEKAKKEGKEFYTDHGYVLHVSCQIVALGKPHSPSSEKLSK